MKHTFLFLFIIFKYSLVSLGQEELGCHPQSCLPASVNEDDYYNINFSVQVNGEKVYGHNIIINDQYKQGELRLNCHYCYGNLYIHKSDFEQLRSLSQNNIIINIRATLDDPNNEYIDNREYHIDYPINYLCSSFQTINIVDKRTYKDYDKYIDTVYRDKNFDYNIKTTYMNIFYIGKE